MTRLTIDCDQDQPGFGLNDLFFDTGEGGRGADHAFPFTIVSLTTRDPEASVVATVADGQSLLTLDLQGFQAGDRLVFSIDVEEVEQFDPKETDLGVINDGFDPITSGVEFQGSRLTAHFSAPRHHDINGSAEFRNRYDDVLNGLDLNLPADDEGGKRDRSAGGGLSLVQKPLPISISGHVYLETNLDLVRDPGESGLPNVELSLWQKQGTQFVFTGQTTRTQSDGSYLFGVGLDLPPGTYQVRETQPSGLFSVGAIRGSVDGAAVGSTVPGNPDMLTDIAIPLGDQHGINYDFAEARPAAISGHVYHDRDNDGRRDSGEEGLSEVAISVIPIDTVAPQATIQVKTNSAGFYEATGLAPGTYRVVEAGQPAGYFDGRDAAGTVAGVSVGYAVNPGDQLEEIFLGGGQQGIDYDFGEIAPSSLRGHVYLSDRDGVCFGPDSRPLAGVAVQLLDSSGTLLRETQTDESGGYEFLDLLPGTYTVVEATPAGLIDGAERPGQVAGVPLGRVVANDRIGEITLAPAQQGLDYDFCEHEPASVSGYVFHDANDNGQRDPGETPIAGVEVVLLDAAGRR